MGLSSDLLLQFVKVTKDDKKQSNEATVYGTVVYDGKTYVKIDGSELLTPVETTVNAKDGERVTVLIKDHTATITGNISSPSARNEDVEEVSNQITEVGILLAHRVTTNELNAINAVIENLRAKLITVGKLDATEAEIGKLEADFADVEYLTAKDITAINADIENLKAKLGQFEDLSTEELEALHAEIILLEGHSADFTYVSADVLSAIKAEIKNLNVDSLESKYANIDFANIGEAAIRKIFSEIGIIKDITVDEATITDNLIAVTIKGDVIEANTLKADRLIVKGDDGLYYQLNFNGGTFTEGEEVPTDSIHGSVITAKSITAEKVNVSDLVAFDATIGGFNITSSSIYSGAKNNYHNTTPGVYMDKVGNFYLGDANNYIKFIRTQVRPGEQVWSLDISANTISLGGSTNIKEAIDASVNAVERYYYLQTSNDKVPSKPVVYPPTRCGDTLTWDGVVLNESNIEQIFGGKWWYLVDGVVPDYVINDEDPWTVVGVTSSGDTQTLSITSGCISESANGSYVTVYTDEDHSDMCVIIVKEDNCLVGPISVDKKGIYFLQSNTSSGAEITLVTSLTIPGYACFIDPNAPWTTVEPVYVKDESGSDTLTWDGNTTGKEVFSFEGMNFCFVSTATPTIEELSDGIITVSNGVMLPLTPMYIGDGDDVVMDESGAFVVALCDDAELVFGGETLVSFSKKGLYFLFEEDNHVQSLTINGYTGFKSANNLYYVDVTRFVDGSFVYSDVILASTYEDAKNADDAMTDANNELNNRLVTAQQIIDSLSAQILTIVSDENGATQLTQTSTGWVYDLTSLTNDINHANASVDSLNEKTNGIVDELLLVDDSLESLQSQLNEFGVMTDYVHIGIYNNQPCIELGEYDSDFKVRITNTDIQFIVGSDIPAWINNDALYIKKATITQELRHGYWVWKQREYGSYGLLWIPPITITEQPYSQTHPAGTTVYYGVTAQGSGLTYQWQAYTTSATAWKNSSFPGNNTSVLAVEATRARSGYLFRCIITDAAGNSISSDIVSLTVT